MLHTLRILELMDYAVGGSWRYGEGLGMILLEDRWYNAITWSNTSLTRAGRPLSIAHKRVLGKVYYC